MNRNQINFIKEGEEFLTSKGCRFVVDKYLSSTKVSIRFLDDKGFQKVTTSACIRSGTVKNPYKKGVCGVGYIGVGKYNTSDKAYGVWAAILLRCYDKDAQEKSLRSYIGCSVGEEWHDFQNFARWYYENKYRKEGWGIDKDFCVMGNRVYGENFCTFLPPEINNVLINSLNQTSGISYDIKRECYLVRLSRDGLNKNLGRYSSKEDAIKTYKEAKTEYIEQLCKKYSGEVDPRVIHNLRSIKIHE